MKKTLQKIKENKKTILLYLVIFIVSVYSLYTWKLARLETELLYDYFPDGGIIEHVDFLNYYYNVAFKKILLFGGFMFISTFLLLKNKK